ncbi:protein FAR1-RELATED SEQUENCE 5-like [Quercus suber]|uniref:protein FAR1-RELATED SEQUENCE 5-like n=1 Tax=Quercus suber TaxID=58331 RepID=UPI0032DE67C1
MDGSQMQQPLISSDQLDIPSLHLLPPSLIPPHSVSHSANAAPISSPPRTTTPTAPTAPTAPSCLGILPDSDKCNGRSSVKPIDGNPNTPSKYNKEIKAPMIVMKFDCDDSVYEFYKQYAHKMGLIVRKQYVRRGSAGHVKRRTFCCSKESELLTNVVNWKITPAQQAFVDDAKKSGVSIKQTIDLLSMRVGGYENLGFLNVDYKNHVNSKRREALKRGYGHVVMDHFRKMQLEDPSYFYSIQLDDDNQILNILWADSRSIVDYGHFGDVICFDTTYRTNSYGRPFVPFIGVNHHKPSIVFGAALLYDETIMSFKWLFETFLSAMSGKQPRTIFIDQSATMANAIEDVFPESNHRLCVWHIYQNAAKRLHHIFNSSSQFRNAFSNCVYDFEDENEWIVAWNYMLETYDLTDNPWLCEMFDVKEKWCMVYGRHKFTTDMKSTQCSESMNSVLKKYLKPKHSLLQFFGHYSRVLSDKRSQELQAEFKMRQTTLVLLFDFEMLRHAAKLYTSEIFKMFQDEYVKIVDCTIYKASKFDSITEYRDLQQMRIKCCLSSMEDEVHGEVVPKNVLQGDSGFESHVDISQGICGIKTKPTESFDFEFLVGQDHIGLYGLNQVSIDPDIDKL